MTAFSRRVHLMAIVFVCAPWATGCDASLETRCITGENCADYQPPSGMPDGTGGGGGGGGMACYEGCDTMTVSGNTGEYPCEVEPIIEICRNCHVDGGTAPFSLNTYEDSQELYGMDTRWSRFKVNIDSNFMPLGGPPLEAEQKTALLDDWACQCAPPRPAGETCN